MLRHLLCIIFLSTIAVHAANGWYRLSELKPGDRIVVVQLDQKQYEGKFLGVSSDSLALETTAGGMTIDRDRIVRISRRNSRRLRNGLFGAGAGIAAAAALDRTVGTRLDNYGTLETAAVWGIPLAIGIGAGVAADSDATIYRVEQPPNR